MPLHRPYIRDNVRLEVERRALKNDKGEFLDANTGKAIKGQYDLGHKSGHEHWRETEKAEAEGLTQEQFNERMNNPDFDQIEDPHENRSHVHEDKSANTESKTLSKQRNGEITQDKSAFTQSKTLSQQRKGNSASTTSSKGNKIGHSH